MPSVKKFIQVVNLYPLTYNTKDDMFLRTEDYMLIHDTIMKENGFDCDIVTLRAQGSKTIETKTLGKYASDEAPVEYYEGFKITRFDTTRQLLKYVRKHKGAIVQSNLRSFPASSFVGLPFVGSRGKRVMRSYTYVMGSSLPIALFTAAVFRRFDRILAVTPYEADVYRRWKVPGKKIRLIPLAIDYPVYSRRVPHEGVREMFGIGKNDKVAIAVANVRKHKRYDVLLKAIPLIKQEIPDFKVVIIGEDMLEKGQSLPSVAKMAADLGVSGSVLLTGFQPWNVLQQLYSLSDVFVHTAENEYQGLVSYEAAAMGIPLCLSNIGSHTSVFREHALYHGVEDYRRLAENVVASIRQRESRENSISFLREHMKKWDYPVIKKQLSEMYDELISE
ncbi:TPA: glycosyltransferase family 4 protein [Candidatus Woesearchaeota archaeon]|nr:glycosyltransferase family 4 protein [Candidatus Woesearchaeota archaeon]